jgi:hypothetical protein
MKTIVSTVALVLIAGVLSIDVLRAQDPPQSAAAATTVKALLEQLKMESIATRDPEEPGRYIAALYIQDSQLLVVSAPYTVPAALDRLIAAGSYTDAYVSLQAVQDHRGHFFIVDSLANGLKKAPDVDQLFDSTTTDGSVTVMFDGKWDAQRLNAEAYDSTFAKNDARYARMLAILANELKKRTTAQ